jgi:ribose transport system substrate-binding protein
MKLTKNPKVRVLGISLTAALTLAMAGCSSSGSGGNKTTGSASGSTSSAGGTAASEVKAAEAALKPVLVPPTKIFLTTPLPKAPSPGLMISMNCDVPACTVIGNGVKAGVEAGGWKYATENYLSADPATLKSALLRALAKHPSAVTLAGIPPAAGWSAVLPAYKKAGVPIIPTFLAGQALDETIIASPGGPPARKATAITMANWFIADSKGKGHALLQRVDGFPVVKLWSDTFAATVKAKCSGCKIDELSNTIGDATGGKIVSSIMPKLQSDRSINYVFGDLEFYDALPAAMKAAGLNGKVKVAGQTPDVAGLNFLKQGVFSAATPAPNNYVGWVVADVAFRHQQKLPIPASDEGVLPYQLYLPNTDFAINAGYDKPLDYPQQFKALWKVS